MYIYTGNDEHFCVYIASFHELIVHSNFRSPPVYKQQVQKV